jgi:uncharacterized spore protein YtfJ
LPGGIIKAKPIEVYKWLSQCMEAYENFDCGNGRKLLVLDEMTALMMKLANVPAKVTGTVKGDAWLTEEVVTRAAAGDSAGGTMWGSAQNGHNTGVGMDGGAKSQLTPIALISIKHCQLVKLYLRLILYQVTTNSAVMKLSTSASSPDRTGYLPRWLKQLVSDASAT